ncbi:MAG: HEAT repeat domain-containing protein [Candidatus Brocadiales bacterium]
MSNNGKSFWLKPQGIVAIVTILGLIFTIVDAIRDKPIIVKFTEQPSQQTAMTTVTVPQKDIQPDADAEGRVQEKQKKQEETKKSEEQQKAMGETKDPRFETLVDKLKPGNWSATRRDAAKALGRLNDPRAVGLLIYALDDGVADVQAEAAWSLGKIKDLRAVESLIAILTVWESSDVRRVAAWALREITGENFEIDEYKWQKWWKKNKEKFRNVGGAGSLQDSSLRSE